MKLRLVAADWFFRQAHHKVGALINFEMIQNFFNYCSVPQFGRKPSEDLEKTHAS